MVSDRKPRIVRKSIGEVRCPKCGLTLRHDVRVGEHEVTVSWRCRACGTTGCQIPDRILWMGASRLLHCPGCGRNTFWQDSMGKVRFGDDAVPEWAERCSSCGLVRKEGG